jgi:hypothetical protein
MSTRRESLMRHVPHAASVEEACALCTAGATHALIDDTTGPVGYLFVCCAHLATLGGTCATTDVRVPLIADYTRPTRSSIVTDFTTAASGRVWTYGANAEITVRARHGGRYDVTCNGLRSAYLRITPAVDMVERALLVRYK